jgi:hypothetical protein
MQIVNSRGLAPDRIIQDPVDHGCSFVLQIAQANRLRRWLISMSRARESGKSGQQQQSTAVPARYEQAPQLS